MIYTITKKKILLSLLSIAIIIPSSLHNESNISQLIKKMMHLILNNSPKIPASKTGVSIVFDLNGVLLNIDTKKALNEMGTLNIFKYITKHNINPLKVKQALLKKSYEIFNYLQKEGNCGSACDPYGNLMPGIICDWQKGLKTNADLHHHLSIALHNHPEWFSSSIEKKLIHKVILKMFVPERLISTITLINEGLAYVQQCKSQGHTLFVLSNWDKESFELLYQKFPQLFCLFDGVLISGAINTMKPEPDAYAPFVQRKESYNETIIFIDDQIENIEAARQAGLHGIWCPTPSNFLGIKTSPSFNSIEKEVAAIIYNNNPLNKNIPAY